jgi:transposase
MTEEGAIREAGEALAAQAAAGRPFEKLPELQRRMREQLAALEQTRKKIVEEQDEADRKPSKSAVPKLLKAGGQGYRLWKATHETLATEMSTRSPPLPDMVASPAVRSDAQRFQVRPCFVLRGQG